MGANVIYRICKYTEQHNIRYNISTRPCTISQHGVYSKWLHRPNVRASLGLLHPRHRPRHPPHHHADDIHAQRLSVAQGGHLRLGMGGAAHHRDDSDIHGQDGPSERQLVLDYQLTDGAAVRADARVEDCHHLLHGGHLHLRVVVHE